MFFLKWAKTFINFFRKYIKYFFYFVFFGCLFSHPVFGEKNQQKQKIAQDTGPWCGLYTRKLIIIPLTRVVLEKPRQSRTNSETSAESSASSASSKNNPSSAPPKKQTPNKKKSSKKKDSSYITDISTKGTCHSGHLQLAKEQTNNTYYSDGFDFTLYLECSSEASSSITNLTVNPQGQVVIKRPDRLTKHRTKAQKQFHEALMTQKGIKSLAAWSDIRGNSATTNESSHNYGELGENNELFNETSFADNTIKIDKLEPRHAGWHFPQMLLNLPAKHLLPTTKGAYGDAFFYTEGVYRVTKVTVQFNQNSMQKTAEAFIVAHNEDIQEKRYIAENSQTTDEEGEGKSFIILLGSKLYYQFSSFTYSTPYGKRETIL